MGELSKFLKSIFDVDEILKTASNLKYVSALKAELKKELSDPSPELVSMLARRVYEGKRLTGTLQDAFKGLIKRSVSDYLREEVSSRLSNALHQTSDLSEDAPEPASEIKTTDEEMEGYRIAVAIAAEVLEPERVIIQDQKSYCGVLIDDNNRRPLVRLWFNSKTRKYVGLFDNDEEEKVQISHPRDIYKLSGRIKDTARKYI